MPPPPTPPSMPPPAGGFPGQPGGFGLAVDHPRANTILWLGITGLFCCMPLAIVSLTMANSAKKEIAASGGSLGGGGKILTGQIFAWISVAWYSLVIVFYVLAIASSS